MESTSICILPPFQMGCRLGGTSKGGQRERLEYLSPCSLQTGHNVAEVLRPLFLSHGLLPKVTNISPSPSHSPSYSRPQSGHC